MNALATISNPSLAQQIAIVAIQKMLSGSFFSICAIDRACDVMNKTLDKETNDYLMALHCVPFNMMTPDVSKFVFDVCNAVCK